MLNDLSSPLSLLETRRSSRPRDLVTPGPSSAELDRIVTIAARTPDHGKLAPWRFVEIVDRDAFALLLERAYRAANPDPGRLEIEAAHNFAHQAPTLIVLLSTPIVGHKIPMWEQELSCGAAAMNLLHAAHALGYGAGWVTGWATFSDIVRDAFGGADDRIAGFLFIGTPSVVPDERPRPALENIWTRWQGA